MRNGNRDWWKHSPGGPAAPWQRPEIENPKTSRVTQFHCYQPQEVRYISASRPWHVQKPWWIKPSKHHATWSIQTGMPSRTVVKLTIAWIFKSWCSRTSYPRISKFSAPANLISIFTGPWTPSLLSLKGVCVRRQAKYLISLNILAVAVGHVGKRRHCKRGKYC